MSALASSLPAPTEVVAAKSKPGPRGACAVYGPGDKEDWLAVDVLRNEHDWKTARAEVHSKLGLDKVPDRDKFRYHWRGRCGCWTPELKEWIDEQIAAQQLAARS